MEFSIEAEKLTKKFGNFTAVDSISFNVKKGEIFGFLGANGAGKSTAIKMLCGLLKPTSGFAKVANFDVFKEAKEIKKRIDYMSQKFSLYDDLTILENIQFYGGIYGLSKKQVLEKSNILVQKLKLDNIKNELIQSLPLGWKQKLAFSVAIIHEPEIVFLDEPTGGVDPITRRQFWELIYETADQGITVFVTTHYMDEAECCNRISIMSAGLIEAIGSPSQLKQKYQTDSIDDVFVKIARDNPQ